MEKIGVVARLRAFLSRCIEPPVQAIRALNDGFAVDEDGIESFRVRWLDVLEIVAFKKDLITTDSVCLGFRRTSDDVYAVVNEDMPGFEQLASELTRRFDDIPEDWFAAVEQPAFATNWTRLHGDAPGGS
jgi:hypothetical protein